MSTYSLRGVLLGSLVVVSQMVTAQWKEYDPKQYSLPGRIDYKLSGYVNPEYHYRELNAVFHLTGSYTNSVAKTNEKVTNDGFNMSPDAAFSGYSVHNSPRLQQSTSWQAAVGTSLWNSNSNRPDAEVTSDDRFTAGSNMSYRTEALFYRGKRYWGIGGSTALYFRTGHYKYEQTAVAKQLHETENRDLSIYAAPRFTIGWGRIEQTGNAWQAVQLIRSLQRANRLAVVPSAEVITRLADKITLLRNRRAFDQRLKTIDDLVELDSTLSAFGLVSKGDVVSFAAVNDIWSYAPRPDRAAGSRWYGGVETSVSWIHRFSTNRREGFTAGDVDEESTKEYNTQNYRLVAGVVMGKPISMEWQRIVVIELRAGYGNNLNTADAGTLFAPAVALEAELEYTYYPDTRTNLTTGLTGFLSQTIVKYKEPDTGNSDPTELDSEKFAASLGAYTRYNHYLSPSLSLNLQAQANYSLTQTDHGDEVGVYNLLPGLSYNKGFDLNVSGTLVYHLR